MKAMIREIACHLPERVLTNDQLAEEYPGWSAEKIEEKTGIRERHIAGETECASDLAVAAAQKLFARGGVDPKQVDCVLLCTESPDYPLPTTACLIQDRLGLPTNCGALDFNLGCSGFVYGLGMAKGLIETGQAENVLLLTAETYSKYIHPGDKSVRTIFGDGASATLVQGAQGEEKIGPFVYGTDGSGAKNLMVATGGGRRARVIDAETTEDSSGNRRTINNLSMNGAEIFNFTLKAVPEAFSRLLTLSGKSMEEIDLFVLHQANRYMLEHLRRKLKIPDEKLPLAMAHCGNTFSSSIPIVLEGLAASGRLKTGQCLMLLGFGVGYSWGGTLVHW